MRTALLQMKTSMSPVENLDRAEEMLRGASASEEEVLVADLDPARIEEVRKAWPFYRDRRPAAYQAIVDA
jgi:N-carbamoylputrescine amidase